jgi:uncharacterized DUF497 family protein
MYILNMRFEWDPEKASRNLAKHGIAFEEAVTAFDDPCYLMRDDIQHSTWLRNGFFSLVKCIHGQLP